MTAGCRRSLLVAGACWPRGCAAGQAFRRATTRCAPATRPGRRRTTAARSRPRPTTPNYKIALERAMLAASRAHLEQAREFEDAGSARGGAAASTGSPANTIRPTARRPPRSPTLEQTIRERIEAARPRPADRAAARAGARRVGRSRCSTRRRASRSTCSFTNASLRDILNFIGNVDRHQHHLRPRRPGSADHGSARRRHARAGAASRS